MTRLTVPHKFVPRSYQLPVFEAYLRGVRRFITCWHRRSGKDTTWLNFTIVRMLERVGQYWHVLPTYTQAKAIIWEGKNRLGMSFLDHFPAPLVRRRSVSDLLVELYNGSTYKLIGSDHIDRIVGTNPVGIVFSEFALQDPHAWEYTAPILTENGGWAAFNSTPRGRNHFFALWERNRNNPTWFCSIKTVNDTRRDARETDGSQLEGENGDFVVTAAQLEEERRSGREEELIAQEYYCSFAGYMAGSYYSKLMVELQEQGRGDRVPHEPRLPVVTVWDLGVADATAIWFCQVAGKEVRLIDYLEAHGEGLPYYVRALREGPRAAYLYDSHWAPHDIEVRELSSGMSRRELARGLGLEFRVVPNLPLADGIEAARALLPRCWIDGERCARGVRALINYHKEWDSKGGQYRSYPVHDEWSHGADAFRYLALIIDRISNNEYSKPMTCETGFDIFQR